MLEFISAQVIRRAYIMSNVALWCEVANETDAGASQKRSSRVSHSGEKNGGAAGFTTKIVESRCENWKKRQLNT